VWSVGGDQVDARLDAFLGQRLADEGYSRAEAQAWIKGGRAQVVRGDEVFEQPKRSRRLRDGDEVVLRLPPPPEPPGPLLPEDLPLRILHQDEAILVVDKPAGLTVHPGAGQPSGTLANALLALSPGRLSTIGGPERPGIVHRLDKDTSGVMVIARSDRAHRHLARQFHDRLVSKRYLALVEGSAGDLTRLDGLEVDAPLGRHPKDRKRMAVVDGGRPSTTRFRVLERFVAQTGAWALVEAAPRTGRTHQIRVHLKHVGCPILADGTYGRADRFPSAGPVALLERHALHAASLTFQHPQGGEPRTFEAALHADMQGALERLRSQA
jgi:23S rRNA pseudouridine1911/1915/1917 synthase